MNYRTFSDLTETVKKNLHLIPTVDCVAGIPRSGMLPASIIATMKNLPLANVNELLTASWRETRHGGRWAEPDHFWNKTILLVDDTISGGETFSRIGKQLREVYSRANIVTLAVYCKTMRAQADLNFEVVLGPRVFEWNWYRHHHIKTAVLDIDGVICSEAPNGLSEEEFVHNRINGQLLRRPTHAPLAYATGRKEKYRELTEKWLRDHNVPFTALYMTQPGSNARKTKLQAIQDTGAKWMVESNGEQAGWLSTFAGIPILCTDANIMFPSSPRVQD